MAGRYTRPRATGAAAAPPRAGRRGGPSDAPPDAGGMGGWTRVRALLSVADRDGHRRPRARPADARRRDLRDRRHPRAPRQRRHRGRLGHRPDRGQPIVGGQVKTFHPAVYAGILARRDEPRPAGRARGTASGRSTSWSSTSSRSRPAIGVARRHRRGDRDDRRRRRGAPGGGRAQLRRRRGGSEPAALPAVVDEIRELGHVSPESRAAPRGRGVRHGRRVPRRDRRLPQPDRRHHLPEPADAGPREGRRPALRREPAPARRVLPRDDPPQRHARRREPAPGRAARRSTTCSTSTPRTASRATSRRRPCAIAKHTDPVGLASHDELVEAYRQALETDPVASFGGIVGVNRELDGATAREIAANSYEAVVAPGFSDAALGILRGKAGLALLACRPTRPRACATTASPTSTSSASTAGCSSRRSTSSGSTAASSRSSPSAARRSRS